MNSKSNSINFKTSTKYVNVWNRNNVGAWNFLFTKIYMILNNFLHCRSFRWYSTFMMFLHWYQSFINVMMLFTLYILWYVTLLCLILLIVFACVTFQLHYYCFGFLWPPTTDNICNTLLGISGCKILYRFVTGTKQVLNWI